MKVVHHVRCLLCLSLNFFITVSTLWNVLSKYSGWIFYICMHYYWWTIIAYYLHLYNFYIQVPYEILNKKFRAAQKVIDREVSLVHSATNDLTNGLGSVPVKVGEITVFLDGVVQKLQSLKRKVSCTPWELLLCWKFTRWVRDDCWNFCWWLVMISKAQCAFWGYNDSILNTISEPSSPTILLVTTM